MGCASSILLENDYADSGYGRVGGDPFFYNHHIVTLSSTTCSLLSLDTATQTSIVANQVCRNNSPLFSIPSPASMTRDDPRNESVSTGEGTLNVEFHNGIQPIDEHFSKPLKNLINILPDSGEKNENVDFPQICRTQNASKSIVNTKYSIESFEELCPPHGEDAVVVYTTTLRGIRRTFDDCNVVRTVLTGLGVRVVERDVSMHLGFREELRDLMKHKGTATLPRVFIKGRYIGGAEEILRLHDDGVLSELVAGFPKSRIPAICNLCGGARFLPCSNCNGSCKIVKKIEVERCPDCNENGLILCPFCS